jgi:hypothetical protein
MALRARTSQLAAASAVSLAPGDPAQFGGQMAASAPKPFANVRCSACQG